MAKRLRNGLTPVRLRAFLGVLWITLMLPLGVLFYQTQQQLKWESYHHYQGLVDEFAQRIDTSLQELIAAEEAHSYADYQFILLAGDSNSANYVQRSPLAQYPVPSEVPGLIGYFQVDATGKFSTPLVPETPEDAARWGVGSDELPKRVALRDQMLAVLTQNAWAERRQDKDKRDRPLTPAPVQNAEATADSAPAASGAQAQRAFDMLSSVAPPALEKAEQKQEQRVILDESVFDDSLKKAAPKPASKTVIPQQQRTNAVTRAARKEKTAVFDGALFEGVARVRMFESEVDPFELALLNSGHFVLFRKVWRDGQRIIQGALIEKNAFLTGAMLQPFQQTVLAQISHLGIVYQGGVLHVEPLVPNVGAATRDYIGAQHALRGTLLQQTRLSAPLGDFQLVWTIDHLPAGPGARVVAWASAALFGVLLVGFVVLYRLGMRQITLARQQQDFVSAVSHELKTPLTSIRMYGEMLREGWVGEEKKREYYQFIHDESERLSRLIANVLQLARMERNDLQLDLKACRVQALMDMLRSRIQAQVERAGFECHLVIEPDCAECEVMVDADAFLQILINLVDNALKFSARAEKRAVDICVVKQNKTVIWSVRDYGPGVPASQMKKIFQLFYRLGDELTRETVGTGIGLALVKQLVLAMEGSVQVINRKPGAEFQVLLPSCIS